MNESLYIHVKGMNKKVDSNYVWQGPTALHCVICWHWWKSASFWMSAKLQSTDDCLSLSNSWW